METENILRCFFDFEQLEEAIPFGNGHINDTFRVCLLEKGVSRQYLLQRFNHRVFKQPYQVMENIGMVARHLSSSKYPYRILKPYPTKKGDWLHIDKEGGYWRMFDFFERTISFEKVTTTEQAFEAAKAYGIFTRTLDSMDVSKLHITIPDFHNGEKRLDDFHHALEEALPDRLREAREEIAEVLQFQELFNRIGQLNLPLRVVHHDTKINNVLFDENITRAVAIIDLDTVMPGTILSDFGDMVRTFTNAADEDEADKSKVKMRSDIYKALTDGFLSEMNELLTTPERANLALAGPWLTLMQVIRFLGDYLVGDVYYKIKYPGHNLVRAKNQLTLFHSMKHLL